MIGRQLIDALARQPEPAPELPAGGREYVVVVTDLNGRRALTHATLLDAAQATWEIGAWRARGDGREYEMREVMGP